MSPAETVWMHAGCGGPVYFDLAGGWCWQCGAGPLHPHTGDRYAHQDDELAAHRERMLELAGDHKRER